MKILFKNSIAENYLDILIATTSWEITIGEFYNSISIGTFDRDFYLKAWSGISLKI